MNKGMKKIASILIALTAVITVFGTSIPVEAAAKAPKKITLQTTAKTIDVKGKATVSVKSVKPSNASRSVRFKSSNKKVATVSSKGVVTGKKRGKATITVTSKKNKKVKKTIRITVKDLKPSSISVSGSVTLNAGETKALNATVKPKGVYCPLSYQSSNTAVATVSSKGVVTAKKNGTAVITVKSKQKNSKGKYLTKKCTVTVTSRVTGLTFADKAKTLKTVGATYTNKLTVAPSTASNKKVTYTSSDPKVATVDASGKVTTKAYGKTTITATAADGSGKTASYTLTVADRVEDGITWQYMTSEELFKALGKNENIIIIDLRPNKIERPEDKEVPDAGYAAGHIEGSVHVPAWPLGDQAKEDMLTTTYLMEQLKDNDSSIVFICQSGAGGAKRAISLMIDEGIDASRMYIQQGGGIDLLKNHKDRLVTGDETFTGEYVISASDAKDRIAKGAILVDTRGVNAGAETAKNAITMTWQEISKTPVTDGTVSGKEGFARSLDPAGMSKQLSAIGLGLKDEIILFSDGYVSGGWGDDGRVAWQLIQCGYQNVKIVNGGLPALKAAGVATQNGPSARNDKKTVEIEKVDTTTHDFTTEALLEKVKAGTVKVVDVRANSEYDGAILYGETSGGHIKGAIHIRFTDLFQHDGMLKSKAELTKMFEAAGLETSDTIATYCTGGIRSAYMQLVLQMCGYTDSHNYAESAYRWSNTKDAGTGEYWDKATAVKSLKFSEDAVTLQAKDQTTKVKLTIKPSNATNKEVVYSSNKPEIATVDASGKVTATGYGEATITAKAVKYPNVMASYKVTVKQTEPYTNQKQVFVSPEWVKNAMDGEMKGYEDAFVAEVSWGDKTNFKQYADGIIPGSYHINSDAVEYDDCDPWPMGDGIDDFQLYDEKEVKPEDNFNIRSAEQLGTFLKRNNITKDTKVILYGKSAAASDVTRVAFAMLYAGVKDVKVLDGGMPMWVKAGLPTTTKVEVRKEGGTNYTFGADIPVNEKYILGIDKVKTKLENNENFRLVSIRSKDEFVGKVTGYGYIVDGHEGEPLGAVWGHDTDDGSYVINGKTAGIAKLEEILEESNSSVDNELSFYCGTGWRATIPFFIAYQAGKEDISLYDGGWWLWQLKYFGWEEKDVKAEPDKYPIQKVTPEEAVNYAQLSFEKEEITTDADEKELAIGKTAAENRLTVKKTARVKVTPSYKSSNTKVATVDEATGVVTAKGSGTATITAKVGSGEASYQVTVAPSYVTADDLMNDLSGDKTYKLLDVRKAADYEKSHIVGSDSADVDGAVSGSDAAAAEANIKNATDGDSDDTKYVLICYSGKRYAAEATQILMKQGVAGDKIYTLQGGMGEWNKTYSNYNLKSYTSSGNFSFKHGITVAQLKADMDADKEVYTVFDLRSAAEYDKNHIQDAVSTPMSVMIEDKPSERSKEECIGTLKSAVQQNPNGFYVLECYSGNKYANLALEYLKELDVSDQQIIVLEGGRNAWTEAGYSEVPTANN